MTVRNCNWGARCCLIALFITRLLGEPAAAQGLTSVSGVAIDKTKARLENVSLILTNDATGREWKAVTNDIGWYSISQVLPGSYTLRATLPGFKTTAARFEVLVQEVILINLALEVGDVSSVVDVTAPGETVNRINAQIASAFDSAMIRDLPVPSGNIVKLLTLYPGVTVPEQISEFAIDQGGQSNGARNDQQNIEIDGVNANQQERGGAMESAIPTTIDSLQGFNVQTAGYGGIAGRSSGAQVQLVTRGGGDGWHGVFYENYRTTGTSARNYFAPEPTPLIRHRPGVAIGGPILENKLFFFGTVEHHSDRSAMLQTRTVPSTEFLNGNVRYRRTNSSLGTFSTGAGSNLDQLTLIPGDQWNPALIGSSGSFEQYRPFSTDTLRTSPSPADNGVNILNYSFNAPFWRDRNIYISRIDYNVNSRNSIYGRGTLNDDVRTLAAETFPGFDNASERIDNSKGFALNWNSSVTPLLNNSFSVGLTRESFETTGNQVPNYSATIFTNLIQTTGGTRQAIDTWNVSETLSWHRGKHSFQGGVSHRSIDNLYHSYFDVALPTYSGAANVTANINSALRRALGDTEYNLLADTNAVGDALMVATGSVSKLNEGTQFDLAGQQLPSGAPFIRNFILKEWDFFFEDTFRFRPNLTLTYGLHYSLQTPPWERDGVQLNWTDDLGKRWHEMVNTTKTIADFPLLTTQLAGRANGLPDFYHADTNNFAPRLSAAWSVGDGSGLLRQIANKGGPLVVRAGYALTYDRVGGRFARDAAVVGSIGLLTTYNTPVNSFSIDGQGGIARAARIGPGGSLPRSAFPVITQPAFTLPISPSRVGGVSTTGIDPHLHSPSNHLVNLTVSKQLPGEWIVEGSYIGRFARDLVGQVDLASPPNVRDAASGMTWYQATDEIFTRYLDQGKDVGSVQPIAWFENVYPEMKSFVEGRLGTTFASATQAWYAYLLRQTPTGTPLTPGPNAPVSVIDRLTGIEGGLGRNKLINPQVQFLGLFANASRSNYHSGQFTAQRRFGRGLSVTLNYTLSKSMDITSTAEARGVRPNGQTGEGLAADPLNPGLSYSLSDFDRRHQFSSYFLVDLPFGRNRWLGGNVEPALNQIIGGWQVSGIIVGASGRPWNFTDNRFNHHVAGRDQPAVTLPIPFELTKSGTPGSKIPSVYLIPGSASEKTLLGRQNFKNSHPGATIARNQGRGPGYWNTDLSVTKNFDLSSIRDDMRLRFRWETFNLFNHPNFDIPGLTPQGNPAGAGGGTNIDAGATLGQVQNTLGTERVMQFGVRLEF